jgi:hypothetical protein
MDGMKNNMDNFFIIRFRSIVMVLKETTKAKYILTGLATTYNDKSAIGEKTRSCDYPL